VRRGEIWKLCNYTLPNSAVQYCEIYYSRTRFGCLDNDKKKVPACFWWCGENWQSFV